MKSNLIFIKKPALFEALHTSSDTFYAVIDEAIKPHFPEWMVNSKNVHWLTHPEEQKSLEHYGKICEFFLSQGISRHSTLTAIGGGATTDLAGYVAATLLRGIKWNAVPTTLLAMVDGSIGGKVAINMPQGKNLVGAFHLPEKIYLSEEFLTSLPLIETHSGMGEILKYGFLSTKIHDLIIKKSPIHELIRECALYKEKIVESDFKEAGERVLLNFGHTLGHAFESELKIPHGIAVVMGIRYLLEVLSEKEHLGTWKTLVQSLDLSLEKFELSTYPHFSVEKFKNYLKQDKKKSQQKIKLVRIKSVGEGYSEEIDIDLLIKKIEAHEAFH